MLLSMTGFGNASHSSDEASVSVELKAVNNRYLKVSMRLPEAVARFESDVEKIIREHIARGSVQLSFRIKSNSTSSGYSVDAEVLNSYRKQLSSFEATHQYGEGKQPREVSSIP